MGQKEEIISRINELGSRLSGLSSDEKRVKKRILQKLGKLKKELSRYTSNQDENNNEVNEITQKDNENDEQEDGKQSQESTKWTKKQCKLKLKITNSDIAELAQKKQSKAAQKKFNWCIKKGLTPDVHTYTNLLNAYVRCKDMDGAIRTWNSMISAEIQPNIVTYTTLIKGYSENNCILAAQSILMDMLSGTIGEGMSQPPPLPNARTLNTYWRGCIRWGSVAPALEIYYAISSEADLLNSISLDDTSYEYLISLLCQAYETKKAVDLTLSYLQLYSTVKSNTLNINWIEDNPRSEINLNDLPVETPENVRLLLTMATTRTMNIEVILSTATIFFSLSRAFILQQYHEVGKLLLVVTENLIQETKSSALRTAMENRRRSEPSDTDPNHPISHRENNNSIILFIQHRSSELSRDVALLKSYLSSVDENMITENIMKGYLKTLLLYNIHNIEPSVLGTEVWKDQIQTDMLTCLNESFGLKNIFNQKGDKKKYVTCVMKSILASISKVSDCNLTSSGYYIHFPLLYQNGHTSKRKTLQIEENSHKKQKLLRNTDQLLDDRSSLVSFDQMTDLDVKMEICSGNGEWIIEQALQYQRLSTNRSLKPVLWVALEIRADRVYQALCNGILRKATEHVTFLGGDASVILPHLIPDNSLRTIFINHPEPPERTSGGEDRSQGSHLLTESFFRELYRVLKPNGKLTIVTDNRLYAHSLARTIDHINCGSFSWSNIDEPQTEIFPNKVLSVPESDSDSDETVDGVDNTVRPPDFKSNVPTIKVQSGEPGERGDHLETDEGSSYFSRMWKNGSKSRVWNLVLIKKQ